MRSRATGSEASSESTARRSGANRSVAKLGAIWSWRNGKPRREKTASGDSAGEAGDGGASQTGRLQLGQATERENHLRTAAHARVRERHGVHHAWVLHWLSRTGSVVLAQSHGLRGVGVGRGSRAIHGGGGGGLTCRCNRRGNGGRRWVVCESSPPPRAHRCRCYKSGQSPLLS